MTRQEIIVLHDINHMSFREIGDLMGVKRQRAHQVYHGNHYYYKNKDDYAAICRHQSHLYRLKKNGKVRLNKDCLICGPKGQLLGIN